MDEPPRRGLVGNGELVRLFRSDPPRESEDRVERRVRDDEREDERPRDPGGTAIKPLDEQPQQVGKPTDEEELRDVQADE
jgi:hypothetical protein